MIFKIPDILYTAIFQNPSKISRANSEITNNILYRRILLWFPYFHRVLDEGKCYDFSNIQNILYTAIFQNPSKISRANSEKLQ